MKLVLNASMSILIEGGRDHGAGCLVIVSNVGSPIVVEGRLRGAMNVASTDELLPSGLEGRLEKFTELLATAIANAESRSELAASRRRIVTEIRQVVRHGRDVLRCRTDVSGQRVQIKADDGGVSANVGGVNFDR